MTKTAPESEILITVNGTPAHVPASMTLADLLVRHGLVPLRVAIERNRVLVRRDDFHHTGLAPGDEIEIVTLVGGG